ncbi:RDD family protein [Flexibacterium corallicola]|uniref:RDD family protein n=1 Tax=Flexibacterium corallicola TaxID=3037259 RepID=UPI00286F46D2|nr:RDD family protein [Pseudovibrio sp. M1P-2-3]
MSEGLTRHTGKRTAFDPYLQPALFDGVRTKRIFAFFIDVIAILILTVIASVFVFFLGIFTLGLGFFLYAFLWQAVAITYTAFTLGGPDAATPGMKAMGIEMRLWYGDKPYPLLAAVYAILFWISITFLTPLVLLVSLLNGQKRLLHDLVLGTVVINKPVE